MKTKNCADCHKEFELNLKARFKRKYCDKCSKKRKEDWAKIHEIKFEDCDDEE